MGASEGTVCVPSECFMDGIHGAMAATCSGPGAECSRGDRIPFNCSPYRCVVAFGACSTSCTELRDCAEPYVCSPEGSCVSAPAVSSGYASSCAVTPAPGSSRAAASFLLMLFAALLAARRRQSARTQNLNF
jgi:MYXO-CTERM domain-containing protein